MSIFTPRRDARSCVSTMILAILFFVVVFAGNAYPQITTTPNGVTLITEQFPDRLELYLECFEDYNPPTSTYVFNNDGESGIDAGKIDIKNIFDKIEVKVKLTTLGSTSLTVGVFGKSKNSTSWGLIYDKIYTAITPAGEDDYWPILERPQDFRIGTKVDTPGTDSVTINVDFRGDYK